MRGVRRLLASAGFGVVLATLTAVLTAPAVVAALLGSRGRLPNRLTRLWARLLLRVAGVRSSVTGADRIPSGPAVFAANHASALDIPVVFAGLPVDFRVIYKQSLRHVPFVGWALWAGRHVAIDRANPFKARRSLAAAAARIREGTSVVVFPEGTRASGGRPLPFKRGSFVLAIEAGVPVVPVSLVGVRERMPRGLGSLRSGTVRIVVHEPIPTAGRDPEAAAALADETHARVVSALQSSQQEATSA